MQKIIIAAIAKNGVIGKEGTIPWHSKEDMQYFKNLTMGYPVLMGRKTFESLKKPLKGRTNIVITKNPDFHCDLSEVKVFNDIKKAYDFASGVEKADKLFIIGGAEIYKLTIKEADVLSISRMNFEAEGNIHFPEVNWDKWREESKIKFTDFEVVLYCRK